MPVTLSCAKPLPVRPFEWGKCNFIIERSSDIFFCHHLKWSEGCTIHQDPMCQLIYPYLMDWKGKGVEQRKLNINFINHLNYITIYLRFIKEPL